MPRNGSGTYTLPESAFVAGTTIQSAPVNNNFSDIASAITGSLATDGQSSMTGAIKAAAGTVGAPSYAFASDTNTGFFLVAADTIGAVVASTLAAQIAASSTATFFGNLRVSAATLGVAGNIVTSAALVVESSATVGSHIRGGADLFITGSATVGSNLHVGGNISVAGSVLTNFRIAASATITGTLTVTGSIIPTVNMPGRILAIIEDRKAQNTAAQTITADTDVVRELTTTSFNLGTSVGLASNRFTLQAGTWEITWSSPVSPPTNADNESQSFLYNQTAAAEVWRGESVGWIDGNGDGGSPVLKSEGCAVVTIAASAAFEIRHRSAGDSIPGGRPANLSTEVYTRVIVRYA